MACAASMRDALTDLFPPHITANLRNKWAFVHFIVAEDWQANTDSIIAWHEYVKDKEIILVIFQKLYSSLFIWRSLKVMIFLS